MATYLPVAAPMILVLAFLMIPGAMQPGFSLGAYVIFDGLRDPADDDTAFAGGAEQVARLREQVLASPG